ncbi:MAG: Fe-S cluster assembly protein SufD, partial [Bacteroidetes bacterium]|nr:Fe-S cluster assembly protein SufD [Bacteroidota bacterium]
MDNSKNIKKSYINNFKDFENNLNGESDSSFHKIRKQAIKNFAELNFPNRKNEEWRYTNISPLLEQNFSIPNNQIKSDLIDVSSHILKDIDAYILVF